MNTAVEADGSLVYKDNRGTSIATAVASGIVARFMTGGQSPGNVMKYLGDNARRTGASPLYEGNGVLQLAAAEKELQQDKPEKMDLAGNLMAEPDSGSGGASDGVGNPEPGACG